MEKLIFISLEQVKGLQKYMEMYGAEGMQFNLNLLEETLENFGPKLIQLEDGHVVEENKEPTH